MKSFFQHKRTQLLFTLIGALGGFLYWKFIGCTSGSCAIKSVWYWSTLWGASAGYLIGDLIVDFIMKYKRRREENK